jgi:hypothetical protein
MSSLNEQIRQAINSFDTESARLLLRDAMKEADAETYYLASKVAIDDEQKTEFLEKAVELDPFHEKARLALKKGVSVSPQDASVISKNSPSPVQETTSNTDSRLDATRMVTAIVRSDVGEVSLRHIPVDTGMVVTTIRKGAKVFLIARDDMVEWCQALYESPLGVKYGWLPAKDLENMTINNNPINALVV